jgi:hypothetical protein
MPKFGFYEVLGGTPVTTWDADYMTHKGGQVELWNLAPTQDENDILVAVISVEKRCAISDVKLTEASEQPTVYLAAVDQSQPIYDIMTGKPVATPSE